jgi:hypothetical protein
VLTHHLAERMRANRSLAGAGGRMFLPGFGIKLAISK